MLFTAASGQGGQPARVVAHLRYREVDFAPLACEVEVHRGTRFTKEPAFSGLGVFRGSFCLGPDTNLFLPFAWDARAHRLYLDLNRNRDLTDAPAGVIAATDRRGELYRGLPLEFPSPEGPYRILVDAHVLASREAPRVLLLVRSLWEGTVELSGKRWYVAVIGKPDVLESTTGSHHKSRAGCGSLVNPQAMGYWIAINRMAGSWSLEMVKSNVNIGAFLPRHVGSMLTPSHSTEPPPLSRMMSHTNLHSAPKHWAAMGVGGCALAIRLRLNQVFCSTLFSVSSPTSFLGASSVLGMNFA